MGKVLFPGTQNTDDMELAHLPLLHRLAGARRVMIAGAGGGHDLYTGLPLYFYLRPRIPAVFLGNMSFSSLGPDTGSRLTPALTEIDADTEGSDEYFPERALCRWFRQRGEEISVYCFQRTGVLTLTKAWQALAAKLDLDAVILSDGGTDSLMRGDEGGPPCDGLEDSSHSGIHSGTRATHGLGTPQEDMASIAAVHALPLARKVLTCLGFGVDAFDGVCHAHFLEAAAALQGQGAFLGAFSLLPQMPEAQLYVEAVDHALEAMPGSPSVVTNSIASAIESHFGDYHRTWRTVGSRLFINPLMSMYWAFDVDAVARRCLYIRELRNTVSYQDVERVISDFRKGWPGYRAWLPIPL